MIYILHGDDTAASRKFLSILVENKKTQNLDGKSLTISTLEDAIISESLFGDEKVVVVENLLSKNTKKKDFIKFLNESSSQQLLVLWEDKKLLKTTFATLKNTTAKDFLLPSNYFQFLDNFTPTNKKGTFALYHELLKTYAAEQLFFSLTKRVRQLVVLSSGSLTDDLLKMSPWQMNNLQRQLRMWKRESLVNIYNALKKTELKLKTGKLSVSLSKHLDILILSELT